MTNLYDQEGLIEFVLELKERVAALENDKQLLETEVSALTVRVDTLTPKTRPDDELTSRILKLLQSAPHMKLNAVAVAASLDLEDSKGVGNRLSRLSTTGRILRHQQEGKQASYQALHKDRDVPEATR